jgi:excisionase family DNA binding protein
MGTGSVETDNWHCVVLRLSWTRSPVTMHRPARLPVRPPTKEGRADADVLTQRSRRRGSHPRGGRASMKAVHERQDMQPMLLTVEEAAQKLQISRSLLYEEMRRRRVRVVKIRHLTRIRQSELERYVRDCEGEGL